MLFEMWALSVKRVAGDDSSFFQSLAMVLENVNYYSVLRYLITGAEEVFHCAENNV
jgi:hypothetical protein